MEQLFVAALYEPESGQVLHRHSILVMKGGRAVTEAEAVETVFARARAFHDRVEKEPEHVKRKYEAMGQSLAPLDRLKLVVTTDIEHFNVPFFVDPRSGDIVPIPEDEEASHSGRRAGTL